MTAAKSLRQRGIDFDWFEKGPALGGLWRYDNDSGASSTYRSPQIDTSSRSLAYPDFPVPREWPAYVRALQVLEHLERYAAAFGVADAVRTSTGVISVEQSGGRWSVATDRRATVH